jgi:hypothetical protein
MTVPPHRKNLLFVRFFAVDVDIQLLGGHQPPTLSGIYLAGLEEGTMQKLVDCRLGAPDEPGKQVQLLSTSIEVANCH